jgi:2-isopropylmalate synthase
MERESTSTVQGQEQPIRIFDTTLRDGEQSPGASLNRAEKIEIARALEALGVDIIEAGFPIASPDDFEAVREIAGIVRRCSVAGLARCLDGDISRAGEAVKGAAKPRVHVFCATSEIHRKYKLKRAQEEIIKMSVDGVKMARTFVEDVEFSPEDASRTELPFLAEVVSAVIEAGATTVNIPDTVGYSVPTEFAGIIRYLIEHVPNIRNAVISVHCHNDLGLAVANSLAAVEAGARQVECTINGLGERAGNAALEEVVMALRTRRDRLPFSTNIDTKRIFPISHLVASLTGIQPQPNKAIVGANAFAHESGIHQHGMMQNASTYEIINPQDVGIQASRLVLGKHSGRHALRQRLEDLGYHMGDQQLTEAFERFKSLADKKKEIFDEDIISIADDMSRTVTRVWEIGSVQTTTGTGVIPTATVRMRNLQDGSLLQDAATGDGPVDAVYSAIQRIAGITVRLHDYRLKAITGGKDAQGEVIIEVEHDGKRIRGRGVSTDIIEASAMALVDAINRIVSFGEQQKQKQPQVPTL